MQGTLEKRTYSQSELRDMISRHVDPGRVPKKLKIVTDTSDFFRVDYDDVLILEDRPYLIRHYAREGRFGIAEQPKFWVKRAIDLTDGARKIIKMVFSETFSVKVGGLVFDCVRSSGKEARILALVRGHTAFMQGFSARDSAGNIVRVIDYISGMTLDTAVSGVTVNHEVYFYTMYPSLLDHYITLVRAIEFLHRHGERHGDIRRDHIIKEKCGTYRWIDFDFNYWHKENLFGYDLFGLGNILIFITGRGDVTLHALEKSNERLFNRLSAGDRNIIFSSRVANLKKIYPYIPDALNNILLHFSSGADIFYDNTGQFLADLLEARELLNINPSGGEDHVSSESKTFRADEGQACPYRG